MLSQRVNELPAGLAAALQEVHRRLDDAGLRWALTGSAGHRLQGVPVEVHDLDVQTDEPGAWAADRVLAELAIARLAPRESERMGSLFGVYQLGLARVELIGAVKHRRTPDDPWHQALDLTSHDVVRVRWEHLHVPVVCLRYEVAAYQRLGREDRAQLLAEHVAHPVSAENAICGRSIGL